MQNYTIQILGTYITRVFTAESEKIAKLEAREWVATINKNLKTKIIKIN